MHLASKPPPSPNTSRHSNTTHVTLYTTLSHRALLDNTVHPSHCTD
ncbi:uncharacterized protein G2W53_016768 [Senna tora]|uniref:Uncharacterized protein n=1 Tax=Senna tora TaxID=362788 RepID=A0A834WQH6_9FABA|nr:uncharacterized protein G2W53_016768 [Senna tora]